MEKKKIFLKELIKKVKKGKNKFDIFERKNKLN